MATVLNIETATTNCSVSLARNGEVLALLEDNDKNYSHAEKLHVFIESVVQKAQCSLNEIDAIAVSKGPGSYTGLRIGVSAAKGLCFSLQVPLISIATLHSLAMQGANKGYAYVIPVLDARRMEVYSAVYNGNGTSIRETRAEIIEPESFAACLQKNKCLLLGPGATKCEENLVIPEKSLVDFDTTAVPSAREMAALSYEKYVNSNFEDLAYFEPYYLKDFMVGRPAKASGK